MKVTGQEYEIPLILFVKIVRRCWSLILLSTGLILCVRIGVVGGERWSRQVSNNDWIPLANPRSTSSQIRTSDVGNGEISSGSSTIPHLPSLSLPPALQEQYQQQLLQLQKTQENIQKLLILQEQLRAQQQLLQVMDYYKGTNKSIVGQTFDFDEYCNLVFTRFSLKRFYRAVSVTRRTRNACCSKIRYRICKVYRV